MLRPNEWPVRPDGEGGASGGATEQVLARMASLMPGAVTVDADSVGACPSEPGAYLLLLLVGQSAVIEHRHATVTFAPGWYAYAGSAYGPGGIRARVRRHLRRDKKPHWHVDRLTALAQTVDAFALPGGTECALVEILSDSGLFRHALPGFGSSDCRQCASHLLAWQGQESASFSASARSVRSHGK